MKPEQITTAMIGAPRDFFLGLHLGCNNLSIMRTHLDNCGCDYSYWPEWAKTENGHITKAGQAILIYTMMEHARELEELDTTPSSGEIEMDKEGLNYVVENNQTYVYRGNSRFPIARFEYSDTRGWALWYVDPGLVLSIEEIKQLAQIGENLSCEITVEEELPTTATFVDITKGELRMSTFATQIRAMHQMYSLDINSVPTTESSDGRTLTKRLDTFHSILSEEVGEIYDINRSGSEGLAALVEIADVLGDIIVYCQSEALKYGIPLDAVLNIIMESNLSKLGADGLPLKDARGKVLKGPNFFPPEPKIRELLAAKMNGESK